MRESIEESTERLDISVEVSGDRLFFTGKLNKKSKTWIDVSNDPIVEGTLDVDRKNNLVYLNRLDAWVSGKGYGPELLKYAIQYVVEKYGVIKAQGYIESSNSASQSMLQKMGFKRMKETDDGAYWEKSLKESNESIKEATIVTEAGWIHPDGKFEEIPNYTMGDHDRDAYKKLIQSSVDYREAYTEYLKLGHIRCIQSHRGFNIELIKKPTESQMRTIRQMIKEGNGEFFYSARSMKTGQYQGDGSTWKDFIKELPKMP